MKRSLSPVFLSNTNTLCGLSENVTVPEDEFTFVSELIMERITAF